MVVFVTRIISAWLRQQGGSHHRAGRNRPIVDHDQCRNCRSKRVYYQWQHSHITGISLLTRVLCWENTESICTRYLREFAYHCLHVLTLT